MYVRRRRRTWVGGGVNSTSVVKLIPGFGMLWFHAGTTAAVAVTDRSYFLDVFGEQ